MKEDEEPAQPVRHGGSVRPARQVPGEPPWDPCLLAAARDGDPPPRWAHPHRPRCALQEGPSVPRRGAVPAAGRSPAPGERRGRSHPQATL